MSILFSVGCRCEVGNEVAGKGNPMLGIGLDCEERSGISGLVFQNFKVGFRLTFFGP